MAAAGPRRAQGVAASVGPFFAARRLLLARGRANAQRFKNKSRSVSALAGRRSTSSRAAFFERRAAFGRENGFCLTVWTCLDGSQLQRMRPHTSANWAVDKSD